MYQREPIFNLPTSIVRCLTVMVIIQIFLGLLPYIDGVAYQWLFFALAFIPARYTDVVQNIPGGDLADITSFITYMFIHGGAEHLLVNSLFILAFGSAIARRMGDRRFYLYSAFCGIAGAGLHLWIHWGSKIPVIGASAAASGYIAGATLLIFSAYRNNQLHLVRSNLSSIRLLTPLQLITDVRIIVLILLWMIINWLVGDLGFGTDGTTTIAWEAHLGGYIAGIVGTFLLDRKQESDESRVTEN